MGSSSTKTVLPTTPPQELGEFKKLPMVNDEYNIPELPDRRYLTDVKFLIIFIFLVIFLLPFMIYTLIHSDITRLMNGYDICGNVCGENNPVVEGINCSGKNYVNDPVLNYKLDIIIETELDIDPNSPRIFNILGDSMSIVPYNCTTKENCLAIGRLIEGSCIFLDNITIDIEENFPTLHNVTDIEDDDYFKKLWNGIGDSKGFIALMMFIAIVICYSAMIIFRYAVGAFVWFILIGTFSMLIFATVIFWYVVANHKPNVDVTPITVTATFFTILCLICLFFLIKSLKKISLIIQLFEETMKAIFAMPCLLLQPIMTFALMFLVTALFIFFVLNYMSAGILQKDKFDYYSYIPNGTMMFTTWYHGIITILLIFFISGCQDMIIGGSISAWYFTRDKDNLVSPIKKSVYYLFRFHLGTVACGSLLILILRLIRQIAVGLSKNKFIRTCMEFFLKQIEKFFEYFSSNAYIETAMHGQPFYESGKRAIRLLKANIFNVVVLKSVGKFVFFMAKLFILVINMVISIYLKDEDNEMYPVVLFICAIFSYLLADSFFSLFETAVDTMYLCFCEDNSMNDGVTKPYFMSPNLMKFVEESRTTLQPINAVKSENLKPAMPSEAEGY